MIKFFSRLKRRKGFTLTEMIVVTAIIGIIMASVVAFSGPMRDSIKNTEAKADALTINEVLGNYLEHNLAYACKIDAFVGYTYENNVTVIRDAYDPSGGVSNGYKGLAMYASSKGASPKGAVPKKVRVLHAVEVAGVQSKIASLADSGVVDSQFNKWLEQRVLENPNLWYSFTHRRFYSQTPEIYGE